MISLEDIKIAHNNISKYIYKTPQVHSTSLSKKNQRVSLKLESMQITGSFKLRGAINKLLSLNDEQKKKGVIAVSTGNHGKGVAYAAKQLGIKSKIFMSNLVPTYRRNAIESLGAIVEIIGSNSDEAEFPKGVINVITGSANEIGKELTTNPIVRKISFTGSTEVGKILLAQCATTVKKVSMELGGHAPFIVFDDADIDEAVSGAMTTKFRNTGQTCICANRIYVHDKVYDEFLEKFSNAVSKIEVGDGFKEGVISGPLIDEFALNKVKEQVVDAVNTGAKITVGGDVHSLGGNFFQPTVISNVTSKAKITYEETFGPVAPLYKFSNDEEVIKMANDTPFGLASYFYSRDIGRVWKVAEALEYGIVAVNTGAPTKAEIPFGGIKESGFGREGSKYGIDDFLEIKYINMAGI